MTPMSSHDGVDFYGEVSGDDLISTKTFPTLLGMGSSPYDVPWLKIGIDGRILFIAKTPLLKYRFDLLMNNQNGNFTKELNLNGHTVKVGLMDGTNYVGPVINKLSRDRGYNTDFNRIFYKLVDLPGKSDEGIEYGTLWNYPITSLWLERNNRGGAPDVEWCDNMVVQGRGGYSSATCVFRGHNTIQDAYTHSSSYARAWRPVLELVGTRL